MNWNNSNSQRLWLRSLRCATTLDGVKLIALINSRSDHQDGYHTIVEEAGDYHTAHRHVLDAMARNDGLLSLRIEREDDGIHS